MTDCRKHALTSSASSRRLSRSAPGHAQLKNKRKGLLEPLLYSWHPTNSTLLLLFPHPDKMVVFSLRKHSGTLTSIFWSNNVQGLFPFLTFNSYSSYWYNAFLTWGCWNHISEVGLLTVHIYYCAFAPLSLVLYAFFYALLVQGNGPTRRWLLSEDDTTTPWGCACKNL